MLIIFILDTERDEPGWAYNIDGHKVLHKRGMGADPVLYKLGILVLSLFEILQEKSSW